jgi:two-component system C4-dicarboxylate transport response regulator DctD
MPRVLIVDDDTEVVETLREILERAGHAVQTATSFEDGKRLLVDAPPDVLVTDIRLGRYNGLQLAVIRPAGTTLVVISGHPDSTLEAETSRLGGRFILKPVSAQDLIEAIQRLPT